MERKRFIKRTVQGGLVIGIAIAAGGSGIRPSVDEETGVGDDARTSEAAPTPDETANNMSDCRPVHVVGSSKFGPRLKGARVVKCD